MVLNILNSFLMNEFNRTFFDFFLTLSDIYRHQICKSKLLIAVAINAKSSFDCLWCSLANFMPEDVH